MRAYSTFFTVAALCVLGTLVVATSRAQSGGQFDLSWSTINGGGGTSRGGQFEISGTIGQADAGSLKGGAYALGGGFWSGVTVVQTPGAPNLKIKFIDGGLVVISWPVSANGFMLEQSSMPGQLYQWIAAPQSVVDTATEHTVTVPTAGAMTCYRLTHP
jgi:hypothetical protein